MSDSTFNPPISNPFGLTSVNFVGKPTFVDIDGDGDLDALVGSLDGNTLFFRNISTTASAVFTAPETNPFGLTNVVLHANPTFVDIDGDGDLDAFIGDDAGDTLFYLNTQTTLGTSGLPVDPVFSTPISNPFGLTDAGNIAVPTFVDIDGDGDLDAFIGNQDNILYYQNTGNINNPIFATPISNPFGFNAGFVASALSFTDIDNDGDLDAFVGNLDGNTLFYRNIQTTLGTPLSPVEPIFSTPITNPFGLTNVGFWAKPTFADLNGDGHLDAIVGSFDGSTLFHDNNANTPPPVIPPIVAGTTTVFIEQTPVAVANTITINDPNGSWNGATLKVQITANNTIDDNLALPTVNNGGIWFNPLGVVGGVLMANGTIIGSADVSKVSNDSVWTFTFNESATDALVQDTARAIQFINDSNTPSTVDRTVTFTIDKNAVSNSATQTVNVVAVPDVAISAGINPVEGSTVGTFNITLDSPAPEGGLTINYTLAGTATLATDYTVTAGTNIIGVTDGSFTIAAGETSAVLIINALSDIVLDADETVSLTLMAGTGYQSITFEPNASLSITDKPNNAPILNSPAEINYIDTIFDDSFATVTDLFVANDADGDSLSYGIVDGIDNGDGSVSKIDAYGVLTVTKATGAYQFVPNDAEIEALTTNISTNFTVSVFDGLQSDNKTLTINIVQQGITESVGADVLIGTPNNDTFNGLAGEDTINGGAGDDSYTVDHVGDVINELLDEGEDTVYSSISYTLAANVENLVLIGSSALIGTGNELNNHLTGNGAGSILNGQDGDDNYYISQTGDTIAESANYDWDTVISSIDYTLEDNLEELSLTGTANVNGTGNSQDNKLNGNTGNNILDGRMGADFMQGGTGDDDYYVDNADDVVREVTGEGNDTVHSSISYCLTDNIESLILTGTADINGTGNGLDNTLIGNEANNILKGGAGADIYKLNESNPATDTLRIVCGDSLATQGSYDQALDFKLGTGTIDTAGVDKLDLDSTRIAANTAGINGIDSGIIHSHSISNGMISFDGVDLYSQPLTINNTNLAADILGYLQANITGHKTVAFVAEGNSFVFQDGGVQDTLVELVGVTAQSINTTGLAADSIWIA